MASLVADAPDPNASTVCLTMIVKDEAAVITRCIRSCRPIITSWSIVDTGSTDRTMEIIQKELSDLPGELHERPWKNFAHNKSEAIELAKGKADYDLFMDADDILRIPVGYRLGRLTADSYDLTVEYGGITYPRPHIFRNDGGFLYRSVVHEYLDGPPGHTKARLDKLIYKVVGGGARGRSDTVGKFKRDAETLKQGLKDEPDNDRYVFYLAQSYKDTAVELLARAASRPQSHEDDRRKDQQEAHFYYQKAIVTYERRAKMGGYYQEVFLSLLEIARLSEKVGAALDVITAAYLRAYESLPSRGAEPLYELARYLRLKEKFALGYAYAKAGVGIECPPDGQFIDRSAYDWRCLFEQSVSAYYIQRYEESKKLNDELLAMTRIPAGERPQIEKNRQFAVDRLEPTKIQVRLVAAEDGPVSEPTRSTGPTGPTANAGPTGPNGSTGRTGAVSTAAREHPSTNVSELAEECTLSDGWRRHGE